MSEQLYKAFQKLTVASNFMKMKLLFSEVEPGEVSIILCSNIPQVSCKPEAEEFSGVMPQGFHMPEISGGNNCILIQKSKVLYNGK